MIASFRVEVSVNTLTVQDETYDFRIDGKTPEGVEYDDEMVSMHIDMFLKMRHRYLVEALDRQISNK